MTDQIQDENKLIAERRGKLDAIRENCPANGHPNQFRREHYTADLQAEFGDKSKEELVAEQHVVSVAGRILAKRGPFLALQDMKGQIQAYASKDVQKEIKAKYKDNSHLIKDKNSFINPLDKPKKDEKIVKVRKIKSKIAIKII